MGFAFINFVDPVYILDFYLEFHCMKWSETIANCNSTKYVEIVYANMQGIDEIKRELKDKNIMKKNDNNIKPIIFEDVRATQADIDEVLTKYTENTQFIENYTQRLNQFKELEEQIKEQKKQNKAAEKKIKKQKTEKKEEEKQPQKDKLSIKPPIIDHDSGPQPQSNEPKSGGLKL